MIRIFLLVCVLRNAQGQYAPLIFAAPSAVSHQSRIDIRHTPGFISAPFVYSPIAAYTAVKESESIFPAVIRSEPYFTPVALTFFHNVPLARALEHPISIEEAQEASGPKTHNGAVVEKLDSGSESNDDVNFNKEAVTETERKESTAVYETILEIKS
ncbi:putative cuticle protein [Operophtera brumata]|uniref:Putative cuticle protein n=1 Tax=Operophtera brumata TaxID=104452 RepID=A0A0L7LHB9_OPEBR|nr:putative cuticle protein [Operophtera brumata]